MGRIIRCDTSADLAALTGASCAMGVFDGLHEGHRYLLDRAIESARGRGVRSVAITFDIDPDEKFAGPGFKKLSDNARRIETVAGAGVDDVVVLRFDDRLAASSPEEFMDKAFGGATPAELHVGADFRFGSKASGTVEDLKAWGARHGMDVYAHDLLDVDDAVVSATRIRALLAEGKVAEADALLGHPYTVEGTVVEGRGEGGDMGFKTANLVIAPELLSVGEGVYACYALVDGVRYKAAVNVGIPPTFEDRAKANVEAHILDFEGDLYGKTIALEFIAWLREERKFDSLDELIATVTANIAWVRENL